MKKLCKSITLILSAAVMLIMISGVTAFAQTDYQTNVVLNIEETTASSTEPEQTTSPVQLENETVQPTTNTAVTNNNYQNTDNSTIQTGSIISHSIIIASFVVLCATFLFVRKLKEYD